MEDPMLEFEGVVNIYITVEYLQNPGAIGWGAFLLRGRSPMRKFYGGDPGTTINRSYLIAATRVMDALTDSYEINLYADSQYLCTNMEEERVENWKKRGWQTSNNRPVQNKELWEELLTESHSHQVTWIWNPITDRPNDAEAGAITLSKKAREEALTATSPFMYEEHFDDSYPDDYNH